MAEEKGLQVDMQGYKKAMTDAREMSRGARTKVRGLGLGLMCVSRRLKKCSLDYGCSLC